LLPQVCRIEYRRNDVSREEIRGFDLRMADGTVVTLYDGDAGFEQVAEELKSRWRWVLHRANETAPLAAPGSGSVWIFPGDWG
jgi:hypothetical protein